MLLLNRSPHLEDLSTGLFEQVRRERLLPAAKGNTLHAMQRAVAELGFCDPPQRLTGRHSPQADGGSPAWAEWVERWHGTSTLTPRVRGAVRATLLKVGRWLEAEHLEAAVHLVVHVHAIDVGVAGQPGLKAPCRGLHTP